MLQLGYNIKEGDTMDSLFEEPCKIINNFTAIDLETSGLYPNNRIIEFGAVRYRDGQAVATFQTYATYNGHLSAKVTEITGITDELLATKGIYKDEAMKRFLDFVGDDLLVAHNMDFDWGFLKYHTEAMGACINNEKICTLLLARKKKLPVINNKLETLCNHYQIKSEKFHSALEDAKAAVIFSLNYKKIK